MINVEAILLLIVLVVVLGGLLYLFGYLLLDAIDDYQSPKK